jgi:hypothetical protein
MQHEILRAVAVTHLGLAALHHLAVFVILVVVWVRRESASRVLSFYFAVAFGTVAGALVSGGGLLIVRGLVAAALAVLWTAAAIKGRLELSFARTPRPRLVLMAVAGAFALCYPGYTGEHPPLFIFAPLGVLLPPTLLSANALLAAASATRRGRLHWALAIVGLVSGVLGLFGGGWFHVPLTLVSAYSVWLLLGRERLLPEKGAEGPRSVREIRDRMYSRRSLLPGPRDDRRPGRRVRIRRR